MKIKKKAKGARRAIRYQRYIGEKSNIRLAKQELWTLKGQTTKRDQKKIKD